MVSECASDFEMPAKYLCRSHEVFTIFYQALHSGIKKIGPSFFTVETIHESPGTNGFNVTVTLLKSSMLRHFIKKVFTPY